MTEHEHDEDEGPYPVTALVSALWRFSGGEQFGDAAEFDRRVRQYHVDITDEDTWEPDEVALPIPRVIVKWFGLESPTADEYTDYTLELEADDGARFTAGELLLKLNNAVAPRLKDADHAFFEGLFLTDDPPVDGVPVYEMMQGS